MPKSVAQYSLDGKLVEVYYSVKGAALQNNLSLDFLYHLLRGKNREYKGYVWQAINDKQPAPPKINSTPEKPFINSALRKKLGLSDRKYPFEDMNLLDLEGEIWRPVPEFEEYYMVSNLGRVKWLPRWIYYTDGRKRFEDEKIVRQYISKRTIKDGKNGLLYLIFHIRIENYRQAMMVSRTVYSAFVKKMNSRETDNSLILHRDLDGFNNRVDNLNRATYKEFAKRNIEAGLNPVEISNPKIRRELTVKKSKVVSQYNRNGEFISSFSSIREAFRQTGIDQKSIINSAKQKYPHAGGFLWRYGISTNPLSFVAS